MEGAGGRWDTMAFWAAWDTLTGVESRSESLNLYWLLGAIWQLLLYHFFFAEHLARGNSRGAQCRLPRGQRHCWDHAGCTGPLVPAYSPEIGTADLREGWLPRAGGHWDGPVGQLSGVPTVECTDY